MSEITPLTEIETVAFRERVRRWADAQRALWNRQPTCPTPGCTAGGAETGRICSELPHTSMPPNDSFSPDFSYTSRTDTNRTMNWKGTLGPAPELYRGDK